MEANLHRGEIWTMARMEDGTTQESDGGAEGKTWLMRCCECTFLLGRRIVCRITGYLKQ